MLGSLSIGQRVGIGFMLMLILLCLVVAIATVGIDYVVDSAERLQEGNNLRAELLEHEIDHLDWEDALHIFLTDSRIEQLTIPLADSECKFGQWLYGPRRLHIEARIPELVPLFKALEEPHQRLHASARKIATTFRRADRELPKFLLEQTFTHLHWLFALSNAINNNQQPLTNTLDIALCPLEQWLHDRNAQRLHGHTELQHFWEQLQHSHTRLHTSVQHLLDQASLSHTPTSLVAGSALQQNFLAQVLPQLQDLLTHLKVLKNEALRDIEMEHQSDEILRNDNLPSHNRLQQILHEMRTIVDKHMVTDEEMLLLAQHTRSLITGISILTLLLAAFMAVRTGRDIVAPLNYLTSLLTVNAQTANAVVDSRVTPVLLRHLAPILVTWWARCVSIQNMLCLFVLRGHKRQEHLAINPNITSGIKNTGIAPVPITASTMGLLSTANIPAEVISLTLAINRYTEYQANMAAEQQRFIANVAHQLKNPLAGIYIQMDMLVDDSSHQAAEQRAKLIKLRDSIHRVGRLTHQLLAMARCSPEAIDNQARQIIDLDALIADNASAWFDAAQPKHMDLGFEIAPVTINGVTWLVSEVLNNLIDNAIKYTPAQGRITVRCGYRNFLVTERTDRYPFVEIEDNGPGIPPTERERVFERFYRTHKTSNTGDNSVGLGLAIVKEVINYHNATIEINTPSTEVTGTRFTIRFPLL